MSDVRTGFLFLDGLELRIRSVFEVLDTGLRLYRRHFVYLVALAAIPNMLAAPIFLALAKYWTPAWWQTGGNFLGVVIPQILGGIAALWVSAFQLVLTLMLGAAGMHAIALGGGPSMRSALRSAAARWRAMLAASLGHATVLTILTCATCGIPLLVAVYGTLFCLFAQAMFFENLNLRASLSRSAALARHHFLQTFVILFVTFGIYSEVVESAVTTPIALWGFMRHGLMGLESQVFYGLLGAGRGVAQTLAWPLVVATLFLVYFDLLVRREGIDLRARCDREAASPGLSGLHTAITETA